jgi:hypothetical protein
MQTRAASLPLSRPAGSARMARSQVVCRPGLMPMRARRRGARRGRGRRERGARRRACWATKTATGCLCSRGGGQGGRGKPSVGMMCGWPRAQRGHQWHIPESGPVAPAPTRQAARHSPRRFGCPEHVRTTVSTCSTPFSRPSAPQVQTDSRNNNHRPSFTSFPVGSLPAALATIQPCIRIPPPAGTPVPALSISSSCFGGHITPSISRPAKSTPAHRFSWHSSVHSTKHERGSRYGPPLRVPARSARRRPGGSPLHCMTGHGPCMTRAAPGPDAGNYRLGIDPRPANSSA